MRSFDRRQLLYLAGAAAAAGPLNAAARAPLVHSESPGPDWKRCRPKKALKIGMIQVGDSLLARFQAAKAAGFDGVELDSPWDHDPAEVLEARDAAGIAIPGVVDSRHWHDTLGDPDAKVRAKGRAALETAIHDCKRFGGTTVLLVPAVVNQRIAYQAAYERSQAEIRAVLPLAAEQEITIAVENVWNNFLLSPMEAARYVDEFESPWVGWYFDVGNVVKYGWPEQWIATLGKRIVKLDIKEYSHQRGFDVKIGDGDCGWSRVMTALDRTGFGEGWAAAEVPGGDAERLRDIAERMDRVFASKRESKSP